MGVLGVLLVAVAIALLMSWVVCWFLILREAYEDEPWKALLGFVVPIYLLYFGVAEFEHERKWPIVLWYLFGAGLSGLVMNAGLAMM
jgi:hypothetical protein